MMVSPSNDRLILAERRALVAPRVRFGRAKGISGIMDAIAQEEVKRLVPDAAAPPSFQLPDVLFKLGLSTELADLHDCLGALDLAGGRILVSKHLDDDEFTAPGTFTTGLIRSVVAHCIGRFRLHRVELRQNQPLGLEHQLEANAYAAAFLLPRHLLETEPTLLHLQNLRDGGADVSEEYLWGELEAVAFGFGVTRSMVLNRLARLGFLRRRGRRVLLAPLSKGESDA